MISTLEPLPGIAPLRAAGGERWPVAACHKPAKRLCTLAQAQRWGNGRLTRKYDGRFAPLAIVLPDGNRVTLATEIVRHKSGGFFTATDRAMLARQGAGSNDAKPQVAAGGEFQVAFDVISTEPTDRRAAILEEYRHAGGLVAEEVHDIAATMAAGAEGVCWQSWDWPYGEILAYKAMWEGVCRVRQAAGGTQSVIVEDAATGQLRGKVALRGGKCDAVRVGSLIKLTGMGLTDDGLIREPRPDNDTPKSWLVQF